jgi:DNA-binding transcriptional regulator YiaG
MDAAQFKTARADLSVSQSTLAKALRISLPQVQRYEYGTSNIPGPVAILIDLALRGRWRIHQPRRRKISTT